MSSSTWRTPTQWELFAQNMCDDLDKLNLQLANILKVEPPVPEIPIEPFVIQPPSAPKTDRSHRFRKGLRIPGSPEIRKSENLHSHRQTIGQNTSHGNQSARIIKPKKPNSYPYPFPKDAQYNQATDTFVECAC